MLVRKPAIKVWCLPTLPEETLNRLHEDIVAAAVSVKKLELKDEGDLFVLCPADMMQYGLGIEILIEYNDTVIGWRRNGDELDELAAKLGNAVKKHIPTAFIQCQVNRGTGQHFWTSEQATSREEVERIHAAAVKLLPSFKEIARKECYCESNAVDFKGACHHHCELAVYEHVVEQGALVLGTQDPEEFQSLADVYVADCRRFSCAELHYELGWEKRPSHRPAVAVA